MTLTKNKCVRLSLMLTLCNLGLPNSMFGGTFTAFGPQSYVRDTGAPVTVTNTFSILNPNTQYTLRVDNGGLIDSDTDRVSSTVITVNGVQVVGPNNFNQNVAFVEVAVTLQQANQISVQVRGKPGGTIAVRVFGVDNDPPVINAMATPAANAAGWNDTNVTVTFTCSDATSGVASCPQPQSITTQGANQVVSGTAVDNAGNTATASVTLNIDKTAPAIIASQSSPPNAAGWNNTDVTVSFQCSDSLSGVATCPTSQTVSGEGANQAISGTAIDLAGNSASATATINLDETPPVISISSPANNSVSSISTLQITGTATDALSGVASTTCNGSAAVFQAGSFTCSVNLGPGSNTITIVATDVAGNSSSQSLTVNLGPAITDFNPKSASVGGLITVSGSGFNSGSGTPQVLLSSQSGGTIVAPVASFSATSLSFVVPDGATSGVLAITVGTQTVTSAATLNIVPSSGFSLTVGPSAANLIQGQAVNFAVTLNSDNGFNQLAALSVSGMPSGVTTQFVPPQITAGQTSLLTLFAPANQVVGSATLKITASATVNGIAVSQSANVSLNVQPVATTFIGRASVDDTLQTPLSGVTVAFMGQDGMGGTTSCTAQTQSDTAGNFSFTNLPAGCTGEQLIRYDGTGATTASDRNAGSPVQYAGVDLSYNISANQVTIPPNVIRLPRIDNKETVLVAQNSSQDQIFSFKTIPNLSVTVYAGTTFTLADGSQPNPFPLIAIDVPVDRLPDEMPDLPTTVGAFIVAFQPANSVASQPVAVYFPNTLNTPPGTNMPLETLNPTIGMMVRYGTGTVSSNGAQIVPDLDPAHPNHRFGLVHFDWHRAVIPTPNQSNPGQGCGSCGGTPGGGSGPGNGSGGISGTLGKPVDLFSGIEVITDMDISISGLRGPISIVRTYRSLTNNPGPFGIGTSHNYGYRLDLNALLQEQGVINLIMPDGNQFPFNHQTDGTFTNGTIPAFAGALLTNPFDSVFQLRWKNGTIYQFQPASQGGPRIAFLTSIVDPNGNTTSLTLDPVGNLTQVTDPVGRSLTMTYDGSSRIISITDPIGRAVHYTYNSQGTLATVTNPIGGVTQYTYDSNNNLLTVTDPRGIVQAQNKLDPAGRVIQQVHPDGGTLNFNYAPLNPNAPTSPIMFTTVTDDLGVSASYRFNPQGFITDVVATGGQLRSFKLDSGTNQVLSATEANSTVSFTNDANGNVLTLTDPLDNTTTFSYDPVFNNVTTITDRIGNTTKFTYDPHGNVLTQTDANDHTTSFVYNQFGQPTQITDPLGQKTTLAYDSFGNLASLTDPLGNTSSIIYDAISRPIQAIDALGRRAQTVYDSLDRVSKQINAQGNVTQFSYDANSNLESLTDANGNTTNFTYDSMNRLLTRTDALGKTDTRTYDADGNLIQFIDRRGQTSIFKYDGLNRLVESDYQDSTVVRFYDVLGRLVHAGDSAIGEFDFSYDAAGRLLASVNPIGTVRYSYDADGRTISRQVAGQPALRYSYDSVGNVLSAVLPQASETFVYDARDELISISRANGVTSQYQYDVAGQLLSLIHSGPTGVLNTQSYMYDAVGNRVSYNTNIAQALITQPVSNQYNAGNRLLQSGVSSFSYDANGNVISTANLGGTTTFAWDGRNRLSHISAPGAQANLQYDFAGNLISQSIDGASRTYLVDNLRNIVALNDNGDQEQILSGQSIDQHFALSHSNGRIEYSLTDAINSTVMTADQSGKQIGSFVYEPFGQASSTEASYPFQYTGRVPVIDSYDYYRARYYDSKARRFISEDQLRSETDLYKYVLNSPIDYVDPYGLCASGKCDCPGGVWTSSTRNIEGGGQIGLISVGRILFGGVFTCKSNPAVTVGFISRCWYGGGILSKEPALGWAWGFGRLVCKGIFCREGLGGTESGTYGQWGPLNVFQESGPSGGRCLGEGLEGSDEIIPLGKFRCTTILSPR